jgi:N-acetylmuramoyl-L-alanine amidase
MAATLVLSLLSIDPGYAGWWPWSRDDKKVPPRHAAAPRPAASKPKPSESSSSKPESSKPTQGASQQEASKPTAAKCDPAKFHIMLDVGHTKESEGASSARNIPEFEFNLQLARRIADKLKSEGFVETRLLVTEGKARPSLYKRVAAANASRTDLFLSIHHDSVPDKFLEKWEYDGKKSFFSDRFSGYSLFVSPRNPDFKGSLTFARLIGQQLKAEGLQYASQYDQAFMGKYRRKLLDKEVGVYQYEHLAVLSLTHMKAVLMEGGSIVNRD